MFAKHWSEYVPVTYPAPAVPPVGGGGDVDRQGLEQELLQPAGLRQYQLDYMGAQWTALVSDMALVWDEAYRGHVEFYATNRCDVGKKRREMRHIYFETNADSVFAQTSSGQRSETRRFLGHVMCLQRGIQGRRCSYLAQAD